MTRSEEERLVDILEACRELSSLVARGREAFDAERTISLSTERLLEIIGEAAHALTDATRAKYPTVDWRAITRLRIVLAHHYHRVDRDLVWTMASSDISALMTALEGASDS